MSNIYQKIGIEQILVLNLNVSLEEFSQNFTRNVSSEKHFFLFDILDTSNFKYYGTIRSDLISIRTKISVRTDFLNAKGQLHQKNNKTCLILKIRSFHPIQILILIFGFLFFLFLLYLVFTVENGLGLLVMILPFFILFFTYPIFKARKNLRKLKSQLITDLKSYSGI
ncbi:hypothetical protein [uncultured Winogradskyella sp.]|uniref:hypothetical protein n=1 Tax=uncultured Winogradskyella sp. TaxID=395353 RepID=UPI003510FDD8